MLRSRARRRSLAVGSAVALVGGLGALPALTPAAGAATSATAVAAPQLAFSHMVPVDMQRPGFEPDVKVAPDGTTYTSVPFGFSTTDSFVWASTDAGNSYHLTPGNVGAGKPTTCAGGGDTDLYVDPGNHLYFSDLQGLTNISQSVSSDGGATWSTNCAGVANTPVDRMWFGGTGTLGSGLRLYEDFDQVNTSPSGGNQLVETLSTDGTTFAPVVNANPTSCPGAATNCVSDDEGISGDQVVVPGASTDAVYIAHNNAAQTQAVVSEGTVTPGTPATATWTTSPNLNAGLCPDSSCTDSAGNPEELVGENFVSVARDAAGYLYVAFTAGPLDHTTGDANLGGLSAPEQVYVVHSTAPATTPGSVTWSAPTKVTSAGTNTFPWLTAGDDGRVDVAWYHTDETSEPGTCLSSGSGTCTLYGAANLLHAEWTVQMGQSIDAHDTAPAYQLATVSEHPVKYGQICTNGIGCATGGDRSLGDYLQVGTDNQGAAVISYVDDTSADTADGENAGPEEISRQIGGYSLKASVGTIAGPGGGPGLATDAVSDPTGDAFYSANGTETAAPANLDLTSASLTDGPGGTLVAKIKVPGLTSLAAPTSAGGPDASWMIRWTQVTPGQTGNGHIYYAGMDNEQGAGGTTTPTFFDGDTSCVPPPGTPGEHCKLITYPQTHLLSASQANYDPATGTITLDIPAADVGNPGVGTTLYSVTAFTATSASPQSATTPFNLIDATTPFDHTVAAVPGGAGGAGEGYWLDASDGGIFTFGPAAHFFGSTGGMKLNKPIVGMAADPATGGYWLVASDGGIFSFNAPFFGSTGNLTLNKPIVGMAAAPDGDGYWLVASDGGIFSFGPGAQFHGSTGATRLNRPIVGMAADAATGGYWLVASDGGIFSFDAPFDGSTGNVALNKPIVGMAPAAQGGGYWLVASDGGIFSFGPSAQFFGSTGNITLNRPIVGMAAAAGGDGYWLVASDGGIFSFGPGAPFLGSTGNLTLNRPVVGMAAA
ncbi:MAG TPA: hypothetical protein VFP61_08830 [Acidimicrobiales bacterium]|nr:hypothetical protein [Acidimicrobiales bacterium]